MATKRQRGAAWHYTIRRAGLLPKPIYLSFPTEAEGDAYVRKLEAILDRGIVPPEFTRQTRGDLRSNVERYMVEATTSADDQKLLPVILDRLGTIRLVDLSFQWATEWVTALKREQNLAPSTVRHHVGALSRALSWLAAHGDIPANPLQALPKGYSAYTPADAAFVRKAGGAVKGDEELDRRLERGEEPEIRRLLAGGKPKGRQRPLELHHRESLVLLFDMALESAMRLREMFTLDRGQVDQRKRTIFLDRTKNGDKRQVPITSVLLAALKAYKGDFDGRLFPWWDGDLGPRALARVTSRLSRQYARLFAAAGCKDLHFHDLRHEATSRIYERTTLTDLQVAKITGHRDLRQLKRYANLRGSDLAGRLW